MKIKVAQLAIARDISRNRAKVLEVLEAVEPGEWVVFPEGTLSGYFPGQQPLSDLTENDSRSLQIDSVHISDSVATGVAACRLMSALRPAGAAHQAVGPLSVTRQKAAAPDRPSVAPRTHPHRS